MDCFLFVLKAHFELAQLDLLESNFLPKFPNSYSINSFCKLDKLFYSNL